ncbi:hydrogenase maturation protein, partial [Streptomyces sp. NPDC023588]
AWSSEASAASSPWPAGTSSRTRPRRRRELDEAQRPLASYRAAELDRMRRIFFDPDAPYHALRRAFVGKERPAGTPPHLTERVPGRHGAPRPPRAPDITGTDAHDGAPGTVGC